MSPLTVALIAEEAAGVRALRLVMGGGHRVVAVFSDSRSPGLGPSVGDLAAESEIAVRPAAAVRDPELAGELRALEPDLLLNVHSLHVVAPALLDAARLGAYNLHPGPLPERAGLNAPGWALYEGAEAHGTTLHRMTATVDEGPIAFIERFAIGEAETALELMTKCVRLGLAQLERLLGLAAAGTPIPADPQDLSRRRWFGAGPPEDGRLDWDRPAQAIADFVRACDYGPFESPWPFPRCSGPNGELAIVAASPTGELADADPGTVAAGADGGVLIAAADRWVAVDRVEEQGRRLEAAAVLAPGDRLGAPLGYSARGGWMSDAVEIVLAIFREQLNIEVPAHDAELIESGLLDSLGLVTLVVELEQRFDVRIPFETLEVDDFRTVASIVALVEGGGAQA